MVSVDALNRDDLPLLARLPVCGSFLQEGTLVPGVRSIHPTLTYCCHTTILTGVRPGRHGIYNNELADPARHRNQDWFWHYDRIKAPTLFDLARESGISTAAVLWPVLGGAPVDHNVPEIWSTRKESGLSLFWKYGSRKLLPLVLAKAPLLRGKTQPHLDNFTEAVACRILERKRPGLTAVHFIELDHLRHVHGREGSHVEEALARIDRRIGRLIESTKKAGTYGRTAFVLLGDHGGADCSRIIHLNSLFRKEGLLRCDPGGRILSWSAYACHAGGSAQIHLADPEDALLAGRVGALLQDLARGEDPCLQRVLSVEEARTLHGLDGPFRFVAEAREGCYFRNHALGPVVVPVDPSRGDYVLEHGFSPDVSRMDTLLLAKGAGIRRGAVLGDCSLVDEAPTFARILGLSMEGTEGKILKGMLE
nr:ectonucleotide pyrophosphatase/phosphodiesterase [Anaerotalea alkaliphila]